MNDLYFLTYEGSMTCDLDTSYSDKPPRKDYDGLGIGWPLFLFLLVFVVGAIYF